MSLEHDLLSEFLVPLLLNTGVQRMAREAEEWFLSEEAHWSFSFVSVCAVLGLEPESVRQQLKRWSHSHSQTPQGKIPRVAARHSSRVAA